jgi:DNA mismatch repair protein MutL
LTPVIQVLEPHIANQIAAGEVIERPLNVVKELVENALDAGAGKIDIAIEGSGVALICVRDDGQGMQPDDLLMSIQRHATSKIRRMDDLETLHTLGFRGEALPSIASVARVEIASRPRGTDEGMCIEVAGGERTQISECGSPVGTIVTVRDLFYNTPARRKFLRSPNAEFGRISDLVGRLALARPEVAFTLAHPKQVVLQTDGRNDLRAAIGAVFGMDAARRMIPLQAARGDWQLSGYISPPDQLRSNRQGEVIVVNGRSIHAASVSQAISAAYHGLIPLKYYPWAILHLNLPPAEYDVNVHPTKLEIRLRQEAELSDFISSRIRQALLSGARQNKSSPWVYTDAASAQETARSVREITPPNLRLNFAGPQRVAAAPQQRTEAEAQQREGALGQQTPAKILPQQVEAAMPEDIWPLAQVLQTYIVATDGESLWIIDQHAAHERINYETLWREAQTRPSFSQELLIPVSVEFTLQEEQILLEHLERLRDMGFVLEHFGQRAYILRSVPADIGAIDPEELLHRFLDAILTGPAPPTKEKLMEEWIYLIACHQSVRAKETLTLPEMEELLARLSRTANPLSCPHGRPAMIHLTRRELEKRFHRT